MKEITSYGCEKCGTVYSTPEEARECEKRPIIILPAGVDYRIGDKIKLYDHLGIYLITGFEVILEKAIIETIPFYAHFSIPIINPIREGGIIGPPLHLFGKTGSGWPCVVERKENNIEENLC